ncbi:RecX family transcriptional regulator [Roseomonas sp. BN140053]|uniref:RecX family transcriptional regulator n=1 Tax=Roseomonas sp. BN140053 TaxID=3391898 RepID=UPI0039E75D51
MADGEADGAARRPGKGRRDPARARRDIPAGPPPGGASLREAALNHLAKFSSTEANLVRVLGRRIARWAQRASAEGQPGEAVAAAVAAARAEAVTVARAMVSAGAVDDAAFAASRARRLSRAGRSRRAVAAHLAAKGVAPATAADTLEAAETDEVAAALAHLRRRRQGPFAVNPPDDAARLKALGALARAGFPRDVAERALELDPEAAEARLIAARRD